MDLSGVDIDYLNDKEILDLCNDIVDINSDEICKIGKVDINNSSDEKVQELYDDVLSGNNNYPGVPVTANLNDEQILDNNFNTLDRDFSEILLLNGQNINFDNLTDDEILAIYDDGVSGSDLIAGALYCTWKDTVYYTYDSYLGKHKIRTFQCTDASYGGYCADTISYSGGGSNTYWIPGYSSTSITATCTGYHKADMKFYGNDGSGYVHAYYAGNTYGGWSTCSNTCK